MEEYADEEDTCIEVGEVDDDDVRI